MWRSAAAFLRLAFVEGVCQKANQRAAQERTKLASGTVRLLQCRMFHQMNQELLREVFRLRFVVAACADELVERRPVSSTQVFHGLAPCRLTAQGRLCEKRPLRCGKVHRRLV